MKLTFFKHPVLALVGNLALVYLLFMLCRFVFVGLYADTMTWGHLASLCAAGLLFDTSAILYTNALVILLMLLPLHWKERPGYYKAVRWIFVICNTAALWANLMDCVYFPYTGKRTTTSVFAEFGNEGAGEMAKIFAEQFLANWYLVVLAAIFTWLLWRGFRAPLCPPRRGKSGLMGYYAVQVVTLLLAVPLCVAGMRGGFTHAVRPITISNANQYVDRPAETGIVLNTPFSIYRTLSKKPLVVPNYMGDQEALSLYTPLHMPADSLAFTPRNVVVLILESFGKQHFGFYNQTLRGGTYRGFTPFLDSLIAKGAMTWQYSYSNGRKSIEGMPSTLSSLPNYVEPLFLTPASLNRMSGLARELGERKGYETAFFHGALNGSMTDRVQRGQTIWRRSRLRRYVGHLRRGVPAVLCPHNEPDAAALHDGRLHGIITYALHPARALQGRISQGRAPATGVHWLYRQRPAPLLCHRQAAAVV